MSARGVDVSIMGRELTMPVAMKSVKAYCGLWIISTRKCARFAILARWWGQKKLPSWPRLISRMSF